MAEADASPPHKRQVTESGSGLGELSTILHDLLIYVCNISLELLAPAWQHMVIDLTSMRVQQY